jgi:hypothetical protein
MSFDPFGDVMSERKGKLFREGVLMKLTAGQGCALLIFAAVLISGFQTLVQTPGGIILMVVLVAGVVIGISTYSKNKQRKFLESLEAQALEVDKLANGEFNDEGFVFITKKGEEVVIHLNNILLKEYRSNGSSYSGGYGGVSFRVAKGVRANVGGMQGQSTKNPEESTPLDTGAVTFTNQRIVFAGHNMVREWDLEKIVNMSADDNGVNLEIAVSNRERASVLAGANFPELTPGMAASITLRYKQEGKKAAMEAAKTMAAELRRVVAEERAK